MLRWLILRNFKAFAGEHRIRLAPLTLIFGKNSAGKSSIIQSILFLKQSAASLTAGGEANWVGDDVDLGSMKHSLHGQGRDPNHNRLTIGVVAQRTTAETDLRSSDVETTGFEWTWDVRELEVTDATRRSRQRWGAYVGDDSAPLFTSGIATDNAKVQADQQGDEQGIDNSSQWETRAIPPRRRGRLNLEHFRLQELHKALAQPLASAFARNLCAWADLLDLATADPNARLATEPLVRVWRAAEEFNDILELRWISPHLIGTNYPDRNSLTDIELLEKVVKDWIPNNLEIMINWEYLGESIESVADAFASTLSKLEQTYYKKVKHKILAQFITNKKKIILGRILANPRVRLERWPDETMRLHGRSAPVSLEVRVTEQIEPLWLSRIFEINIIEDDNFRALADILRKNAATWRSVSVEQFVSQVIHFHSVNAAEDDNGAGRQSSLCRAILKHAHQNQSVGISEYSNLSIWYEDSLLNKLYEYWNIDDRKNERDLVEQLSRTTHVKGLRPQMGRTFVGLSESETIQTISGNTQRTLARRLVADPLLVDRINRYLIDVGARYMLSVRSLSNSVFPITTHSIILTDQTNGVMLGTQDVGFGIGQLIPVVTELATKSRGLILIEQPELHLHPKMQADLGEVLAKAIQEAPELQVIAETHSEHIILRLMRLVREGKLPHDLVQILYVDQNDQGQSSPREITLDKYGEFTQDWPGGFFEERMKEL